MRGRLPQKVLSRLQGYKHEVRSEKQSTSTACTNTDITRGSRKIGCAHRTKYRMGWDACVRTTCKRIEPNILASMRCYIAPKTHSHPPEKRQLKAVPFPPSLVPSFTPLYQLILRLLTHDGHDLARRHNPSHPPQHVGLPLPTPGGCGRRSSTAVATAALSAALALAAGPKVDVVVEVGERDAGALQHRNGQGHTGMGARRGRAWASASRA